MLHVGEGSNLDPSSIHLACQHSALVLQVHCDQRAGGLTFVVVGTVGQAFVARGDATNWCTCTQLIKRSTTRFCRNAEHIEYKPFLQHNNFEWPHEVYSSVSFSGMKKKQVPGNPPPPSFNSKEDNMSKVKVVLKLVNGRLSLTVQKGNNIEELNKETNGQERIWNPAVLVMIMEMMRQRRASQCRFLLAIP